MAGIGNPRRRLSVDLKIRQRHAPGLVDGFVLSQRCNRIDDAAAADANRLSFANRMTANTILLRPNVINRSGYPVTTAFDLRALTAEPAAVAPHVAENENSSLRARKAALAKSQPNPALAQGSDLSHSARCTRDCPGNASCITHARSRYSSNPKYVTVF